MTEEQVVTGNASARGIAAKSEVLDLTIDELLTTTRTVRRRLDLTRPVPRSVIEECFELALQAPNADNAQGWAWLVVDDPETKSAIGDIYRASIDEILDALRNARPEGQDQLARMGMAVELDETTQRIYTSVEHLRGHIQDVPMLVIAMMRARTEGLELYESASMWGSVLPAAWSFMLALRSRGLGSAWTTIHLRAEAEMAELLGIPSTFTQVGMFPVAYTIGTDFRPGRRANLDSAVAWNRWGRN
jgi:nitroreductase